MSDSSSGGRDGRRRLSSTAHLHNQNTWQAFHGGGLRRLPHFRVALHVLDAISNQDRPRAFPPPAFQCRSLRVLQCGSLSVSPFAFFLSSLRSLGEEPQIESLTSGAWLRRALRACGRPRTFPLRLLGLLHGACRGLREQVGLPMLAAVNQRNLVVQIPLVCGVILRPDRWQTPFRAQICAGERRAEPSRLASCQSILRPSQPFSRNSTPRSAPKASFLGPRLGARDRAMLSGHPRLMRSRWMVPTERQTLTASASVISPTAV